jgi:hypothetical protein
VKARRAATNALFDLRGNVRVLCRVRSLDAPTAALAAAAAASSPEGKDGGSAAAAGAHFHGGAVGVLVDAAASEVAVFHPASNKTHTWAFPVVFPVGAAQDAVYEEVAPMVQSVLDGYHATIFAYGQVTHSLLVNLQVNEWNATRESKRRGGRAWSLGNRNRNNLYLHSIYVC